jgi:hypothetical protein
MRTKIVLTVALGALFVAVPSASPKHGGGGGGGGAGLAFSAICGADDTCVLNVTAGLAPSTSYVLDVTDNCGHTYFNSGVQSSSTGTLNHVTPFGYAELPGCAVTGVTFALRNRGKGGSLVFTTTATDTGSSAP